LTDDEEPTTPVDSAEVTMAEVDRRRLRELSRLATTLQNSSDDYKLTDCSKLVADLLRQGFNPIVWCRYIATAEYVADGLRQLLARTHLGLRVVSLTSRSGDDEQRAAILKELEEEPKCVLVATDCLSEGIDLQMNFNAAIHYDLPWNPNRLEQREGRVDRFGQKMPEVKTIRFFSLESEIDLIVVHVLLNKAREIHKALGTHVPVPEESESVTEAVLNALFMRKRSPTSDQISLDLDIEVPEVRALHDRMDSYANQEKTNRSRYAQRALKPAEVRQELEITDAVLGDPEAIREFVLSAAQRLGMNIIPNRRYPEIYQVAVSADATVALPDAIKFALPITRSGKWAVTFTSPSPETAEYLGRNHKFVAALARFLMEEALTQTASAVTSRCGVIRTRIVSHLTTILLLRSRYLLNQADRSTLLSEEILVMGFTRASTNGTPIWLPEKETMRLLALAKPDANISMEEKRELIHATLGEWLRLEALLRDPIASRAADLENSHKRVRQAISLGVRRLTVTPQLPPDLLGILVLQPMV
jgi:hypothetical protein